MKDNEIGVSVERLPLDMDVPQKQAMQGYVPTFLQEHLQMMALVCNPNLSSHNQRLALINAAKMNVSLITDTTERGNLWKWFSDEYEKRKKERKPEDVEQDVFLQYEVAVELIGKTMDFVGKHISKPLEIGME